MPEIVQIPCPRCRNHLRIPAAWAEQPLRCKHCQQIFQARRKAIAMGILETVIRPQKANGMSVPAVAALAPRFRARGSFSFKAVLVGGLVLIGVGVAAVVIAVAFGPALQSMYTGDLFETNTTPPKKSDRPPMPVDGIPPKGTNKAEPKIDLSTGKAPPDTGKMPPPDTGKKPIDIVKAPPPDKDKSPPDKDKIPPDKDKTPPDKDKKPVPEEPDKVPANNLAVVKAIFDEIDLLPPTTGLKPEKIKPADLPLFPAAVLDAYKADYPSLADFANKEAEYPLRAALVKTVLALRENAKALNAGNMRKTIKGNLNDKELQVLKKQVNAEQDNIAQRVVVLKDLAKELVDIEDKYRAGETKRLQVLFDFIQLRLKARLIYVYEYNYNLAQIRTDSLPALEEGQNLYRLTPQEKVTVKEETIKQYVKDLKKGWTDLAKNHAETPWTFMAAREQAVQLGLVWQGAKQ